MKIIHELPPELRGSTEQQLRALREYLLRLVLALNEEDKE
jgi:hypothetical protein